MLLEFFLHSTGECSDASLSIIISLVCSNVLTGHVVLSLRDCALCICVVFVFVYLLHLGVHFLVDCVSEVIESYIFSRTAYICFK